MDNNWWEKLQYQCPKCKKYLCFKLVREDKRYYYKKCAECGFEKKQEIAWGKWEMKDGKVFLISNKIKNPIEIELKNIDGALKIVPVK